jgi:hypothetical protein
MSNGTTLEERLTVVEREIAVLKRHIVPRDPSQSWIQRIAGSFKDVPEFDEIVRLGREFRESVE